MFEKYGKRVKNVIIKLFILTKNIMSNNVEQKNV